MQHFDVSSCIESRTVHPLLLFICASNESKSVLARDLDDCRDNHEKLAKRVSYGSIYRKDDNL